MINTVAVTRPHPQLCGTMAKVAARGFKPLAAPVLRLERLGPAPAAGGAKAIALTSRTAAALLQDADHLKTLPAFCVGNATAREAAAAGFPRTISADGDVDALARKIIAAGVSPVIHVCGEDFRGDLVGALRAAGAAAERAVLYRMAPAKALPDAPDGVDAVLLFSPRSAMVFAALGTDPPWSTARVVAISQAAAAGFSGAAIAARPTEAALLDALSALAP
ncbi:MAG: uroporphyrinogen-III synthase [Pseudomonadota bacterium]